MREDRRYEMPKEVEKEIENKFKELSKKYKIPEEDLEEHWPNVLIEIVLESAKR